MFSMHAPSSTLSVLREGEAKDACTAVAINQCAETEVPIPMEDGNRPVAPKVAYHKARRPGVAVKERLEARIVAGHVRW
jgi:hypothetical protein